MPYSGPYTEYGDWTEFESDDFSFGPDGWPCRWRYAIDYWLGNGEGLGKVWKSNYYNDIDPPSRTFSHITEYGPQSSPVASVTVALQQRIESVRL